jgi:hypothetical protein
LPSRKQICSHQASFINWTDHPFINLKPWYHIQNVFVQANLRPSHRSSFLQSLISSRKQAYSFRWWTYQIFHCWHAFCWLCDLDFLRGSVDVLSFTTLSSTKTTLIDVILWSQVERECLANVLWIQWTSKIQYWLFSSRSCQSQRPSSTWYCDFGSRGSV